MTSITKLETIVTPQEFAKTRRNAIITGVLFVMEAALKQFYTGPAGDAPKTDAGKAAEAQYNDMDNAVYHSTLFAETIKALTGDSIRDFSPTGRITWKVGMVVTPVKPAHRERTEDGYTVGKNYFVTNETSGRARGEDNLDKDYLNSKHGFGVVPMSTLNDEWAPVTDQAQIEALVDLLIEKLGTKFVDDMFSEDGKSLLWVAEKLAL